MLKLLFLFFPFFEKNCRDDYLNKTLESKNYGRYYIVVRAKTNSTEGHIVVLNYDLYTLMKSKDKKLADINLYRNTIKKKINNNEPIVFSKRDIVKMSTKISEIDSSVQAWATKGKQEFINHFFYVSKEYNYAKLKHDVPGEYVTSIIKVLFDWNYLLSFVEGNLTIEEKNFCELIENETIK